MRNIFARLIGLFVSDLRLEYELNSNAIACWGDGAFDSGTRRNSKQHYCSNKVLLKVVSSTGEGIHWLSKWLELYGIIGASTPWGRRQDHVFYNLVPFKVGI